MIDLVDRHVAKLRQIPCTRVETGADEDELARPGLDRISQLRVDRGRAKDDVVYEMQTARLERFAVERHARAESTGRPSEAS